MCVLVSSRVRIPKVGIVTFASSERRNVRRHHAGNHVDVGSDSVNCVSNICALELGPVLGDYLQPTNTSCELDEAGRHWNNVSSC